MVISTTGLIALIPDFLSFSVKWVGVLALLSIPSIAWDANLGQMSGWGVLTLHFTFEVILFFILIGHIYDLKYGDKNIGKIIGIVLGTVCGFYILGKSIFKNK